MNQREQQLTVNEALLLQAARGALGEHSQLLDCYRWTVDFLLRHDASLQTATTTATTNRVALPAKIRDNIHSFIQSTCSQVSSLRPRTEV